MPGMILVYDDDPNNAKSWSARLRKAQKDFEVVPIETAEFVEALRGLEERRASARKSSQTGDENKFDHADILVVDYDLLNVDHNIPAQPGPTITGERVSYLARCYSSCKYIIALNQLRQQNPFDLTLKGHLESFADLNLGDMQIDNPGLWKERSNGFRPWYWPVLPKAVARQETRTDLLLGKMDSNIVELLGFDLETLNLIDPSALEFLSKDQEPQQVSVRDFLRKSGNGYRGKDTYPDDEQAARVASSRLAKWLERAILPAQNVLVDLPHLLARYPSLLKRNRGSLTSWNAAFSFSTYVEGKLRSEILEDPRYKYQRVGWLSRPAWFWHKISKCDKIDEVRSPWDVKRESSFVFCEDLSAFLEADKVRGFVSEVSPPFVRRFCVDPEKQTSKKLKEALTKVQYRPLVRFTS